MQVAFVVGVLSNSELVRSAARETEVGGKLLLRDGNNQD